MPQRCRQRQQLKALHVSGLEECKMNGDLSMLLGLHTFVVIEARRKFHEKICTAACNMDKWTFLAEP